MKKAFEIYFATNLPPTLYFKLNPPQPIVPNLPIFEIVMERDRLRRRISKRAKSMLKRGLIDEVARLESKYLNRDLTPMKAVGIKEVLHYFNGVYSKDEMLEKIIINTAKLAKRQTTFNRSKFKSIKRGDATTIGRAILERFSLS